MTEQNPLQRTSDWYQERCGCLTASRAAPLFRGLKKDGTHYQDYTDLVTELVSERITHSVAPHPTTAAMQHGIDCEPLAREAYETRTGEFVDLVGFLPHPTLEWFGASPDGYVGADGLVEIKCLETLHHVDVVAGGVVPEKYKPQLLVQLLVTGRKWVDMCFYDDRLPKEWEDAKVFIVRFEPTQEELADALAKCEAFLAEVAQATEEKVAKLKAILCKGKEPAPEPEPEPEAQPEAKSEAEAEAEAEAKAKARREERAFQMSMKPDHIMAKRWSFQRPKTYGRRRGGDFYG